MNIKTPLCLGLALIVCLAATASPAYAQMRTRWKIDLSENGGVPSTRYLEMSARGDEAGGRYEGGMALGQPNGSTFSANFVAGQTPMIYLRQNDRGYVALYIGRQVEPNHYTGLFMDNGSGSGSFDLRLAASMPAMANILISGGTTNGRQLLSVPRDGSFSDLYGSDDNSGRQKWIVQPSPDGQTYNILIGGGVDGGRRYLSVSQDGSRVDIYGRDDGSGRQRWVLEDLGGGLYHIRIAGGVSTNRAYLSVNADGSRVDLWNVDDGSGRQRWRLVGSR